MREPTVAIDALAADDAVSEALEHLFERDQDIVRLRFGLDDGKAWACDEVGEKYGVTGVRIRQIEAMALAKLRRLECVHQQGKPSKSLNQCHFEANLRVPP